MLNMGYDGYGLWPPFLATYITTHMGSYGYAANRKGNVTSNGWKLTARSLRL
jgi:hypothetical protein